MAGLRYRTNSTNSQAAFSLWMSSNSCSICPNSSHSLERVLSGRPPPGAGGEGQRRFFDSLLFFLDAISELYESGNEFKAIRS